MFDAPPQQHHQQICHKQLQLPFGAMIKIPTETQVDYKNLICTEADQKIIFDVITTVANKSKAYLLWYESDLREKQVRINHVHPFKFLATIFNSPTLKNCMKDVRKDIFKWPGFLDGLCPSLARESKKGTLAKYLEDFAKEINVKSSDLRAHFNNKDWSKPEEWHNHDWEKLVEFFIPHD